MKKIVTILTLTATLFSINYEKLQKEQNQFIKKYEIAVSDDIYTYTTKVLYETNGQARQLLDNAKLVKNPYPLIKKAFDIHTKMQYGIFAILDKEEKKSYIKENKKYIDTLFQTTTTSQNIRDTFNRWLNYKRTLFDSENTLLSDRVMKKTKVILDRKRQELAREYQHRPLNQNRIENLKQNISNFEKNLSSNIYKLSPKVNISYQDISAILKPNELYIDFAKVGNFYYIFSLDNQQHISFTRLNGVQIDSTIKAIQNENQKIIDGSSANLAKAKKQYGELYNLIIKNTNLKNRTSLIISPDGLLNLIPFEAFYNGQYLIERLNIRYIPSGRELIKLYQYSYISNGKVIVFANPNFESSQNSSKTRGDIFRTLTPTFSSLKGSIREVKKIKSLFPNSIILSENNASEKNLFQTISPKILHISTHGFFLKDRDILNPMLKSGIVLSGANRSIRDQRGDGIITALELSGLNLRGTELVVLSACETGVGEIEEAQGVAGINRAFMRAGAREVVMSLWSVSDMATAWLMDKFYEGVSQNMSYSSALRKAKIFMIRNKNSHPYYWSGFIGSGIK